MSLRQPDPQEVLGEGREPDPGHPEEARSQFGVEQPRGPDVAFRQAGEILRRGMQNPFRFPQSRCQRCQVGQRVRIHQECPGPGATELEQERPLAVPVARGSFGVDRHGSPTRRELLHGRAQSRRLVNDVRYPVGRNPQDRQGFRVVAGISTHVVSRVPGQWTRPARMQMATIWARSPVPSLRPIRERWLLTVSADKLSSSPIARLV